MSSDTAYEEEAKFIKENPNFLYLGFGPTQELRDEHHAACVAATATVLPAVTAHNEPLPRANAQPANEASHTASNVALLVRRWPSSDLDAYAAANNNVPGALPAAPPINSTQAITPIAYVLPKGVIIEIHDRPLEWTQDSVAIRSVIEQEFVVSKDFRGQPQLWWEPSGYP
ncbi:predicted protein [Sclerotinia sclerotiorum 1980 UF-70]|uniref:Uncharacterized protein n=2 Tax=Sclerotinia sclerotiorum (strain ATCC 18683 / 1980 / Ss-1) TaxID=665079 RepID=A7F0J7_SCLS1|nr:predicted protein [Sclerotinia sclerotiorum 1980 UF-70]APA14061.1 hypothetical protein sscle_12g088310 [Sclerotinia sclerotiorum 1980 UF-70]EDN95239.1 predicted protein [Sclerotinia sclerotiorum 1980 UF-70]